MMQMRIFEVMSANYHLWHSVSLKLCVRHRWFM